jgi:alpha-galactosidase
MKPKSNLLPFLLPILLLTLHLPLEAAQTTAPPGFVPPSGWDTNRIFATLDSSNTTYVIYYRTNATGIFGNGTDGTIKSNTVTGRWEWFTGTMNTNQSNVTGTNQSGQKAVGSWYTNGAHVGVTTWGYSQGGSGSLSTLTVTNAGGLNQPPVLSSGGIGQLQLDSTLRTLVGGDTNFFVVNAQAMARGIAAAGGLTNAGAFQPTNGNLTALAINNGTSLTNLNVVTFSKRPQVGVVPIGTNGVQTVNDYSRSLVNPLLMQSFSLRKPPMGMDTYALPGGGANSIQSVQQSYADIAKYWGLTGYGWNLINVDSGWQATNYAAGGTVTWDTNKWPMGMPAWTKYCHDRGCRAGIYCEVGVSSDSLGFPGSTNIEADMCNFVNWGFDYIQIDRPGLDESQLYDDNLTALRMRAVAAIQQCSATNGQGRAVMVRGHGVARGNIYESLALNVVYVSVSGTNVDWNSSYLNIYDFWNSLWVHWPQSTAYQGSVGPGHFRYNMDHMGDLVAWGIPIRRTLFNFYAMGPFPMMINEFYTPTNYPVSYTAMTNRDWIAINQDDLVAPGRQVSSNATCEVWTRPLANGDAAVFLVNHQSNATAAASVTLNDICLIGQGPIYFFDVWEKTNCAVTDTYSVTLEAYSSRLFRAIPASRFLQITNGQTAVTLNGNPPPAGNTASGAHSWTAGYNTTASGQSAFAEGDSSTASGGFSGAFGKNTTASGTESFAIGTSATASGTGTLGFAANGNAAGEYSVAIGPKAFAWGNYSFAYGYKSVAKANGSIMFACSALDGDEYRSNNVANSFKAQSTVGVYLESPTLVLGGNIALTNIAAAPAPATGYGILVNSNAVLYWVTSTATNKVSP